jgi:hypothetical protein
MLRNAVLIVVGVCVWTLWDVRRHADDPVDDEFEEREVAYGRRLVGAYGIALLLLVAGLLLNGLGVRVAGWVALFALVVLGLVFYVGPWLGPRRHR